MEDNSFMKKIENNQNCVFCYCFSSSIQKKYEFAFLLHKALQTRYGCLNDEQDKRLDDIMNNNPTEWVVNYKDLIIYEEQEEYLKRYYTKEDISNRKLGHLTEYYKYHYDYPHIYIQKVKKIVDEFVHQQRNAKFHQIKHLLGIQFQNETDKSSNLSYSSFRALDGLSQLQTSRLVLNNLAIIKDVDYSYLSFRKNSFKENKKFQNEFERNMIKGKLKQSVEEFQKKVQVDMESYRSNKQQQQQQLKKSSKKSLQLLLTSPQKQLQTRLPNSKSFQDKDFQRLLTIINSSNGQVKPKAQQFSSYKTSNSNLIKSFRSTTKVQSPKLQSVHQQQQLNLKKKSQPDIINMIKDKSIKNKKKIEMQMSRENALQIYRKWQLQKQTVSQCMINTRKSISNNKLVTESHVRSQHFDVGKRVLTDVQVQSNSRSLHQKQRNIKFLENCYQNNYYSSGLKSIQSRSYKNN